MKQCQKFIKKYNKYKHTRLTIHEKYIIMTTWKAALEEALKHEADLQSIKLSDWIREELQDD